MGQALCISIAANCGNCWRRRRCRRRASNQKSEKANQRIASTAVFNFVASDWHAGRGLLIECNLASPFLPPVTSLYSFSAWTKHRKSQKIFVFLLTLGKSQKLIWNCLSSFSCFANVCVGEAGKVAAKIKKTEIARVVERQTRAASSKQRCTPWASGQVIRYNLAWFGNSCDGMTLETLESLEQC